MKIIYCDHDLIKDHIAEALVMSGLPMMTNVADIGKEIIIFLKRSFSFFVILNYTIFFIFKIFFGNFTYIPISWGSFEVMKKSLYA